MLLKKFSLFQIIITSLIILVVGSRFYDYYILKYIILSVYAPCDITTQKCFIAKDDASLYFDFQNQPYKKIEVLEYNAPICLQEHTCDFFTCNDIQNCTEVLCSDDTLEDGEMCTDEHIEQSLETT